MQTLSAGWTLLENSRRMIGKSPDIFCARNRPGYDCHVSQSNELMRPQPLRVSHDRELIEEPAVDATAIELMARHATLATTESVPARCPHRCLSKLQRNRSQEGFSDAQACIDYVRSPGNAGAWVGSYSCKRGRPMVFKAQGNDELRVRDTGAMPCIQEREGRELLPPAGLTLIAAAHVARPSREGLSKAVAPNQRLVGAVRTILDDHVSLCAAAHRCEGRAGAGRVTAGGRISVERGRPPLQSCKVSDTIRH
jgi:hypothetical protein